MFFLRKTTVLQYSSYFWAQYDSINVNKKYTQFKKNQISNTKQVKTGVISNNTYFSIKVTGMIYSHMFSLIIYYLGFKTKTSKLM